MERSFCFIIAFFNLTIDYQPDANKWRFSLVTYGIKSWGWSLSIQISLFLFMTLVNENFVKWACLFAWNSNRYGFIIKWGYLFPWNCGAVCSHELEHERSSEVKWSLFLSIELEHMGSNWVKWDYYLYGIGAHRKQLIQICLFCKQGIWMLRNSLSNGPFFFFFFAWKWIHMQLRSIHIYLI